MFGAVRTGCTFCSSVCHCETGRIWTQYYSHAVVEVQGLRDSVETASHRVKSGDEIPWVFLCKIEWHVLKSCQLPILQSTHDASHKHCVWSPAETTSLAFCKKITLRARGYFWVWRYLWGLNRNFWRARANKRDFIQILGRLKLTPHWAVNIYWPQGPTDVWHTAFRILTSTPCGSVSQASTGETVLVDGVDKVSGSGGILKGSAACLKKNGKI